MMPNIPQMQKPRGLIEIKLSYHHPFSIHFTPLKILGHFLQRGMRLILNPFSCCWAAIIRAIVCGEELKDKLCDAVTACLSY